ncbi:MAG TPA: dihydroorotate dehydrogenase [Methanomassiliicoccales archaeon]|nr:dihydroorotate dehydrogenase [Methanomassiliicoccales archaeon]
MGALTTRVASLELANPLILASGVMGETGDSLLAVIEGGAGAVVTKSIGLEPRKGYGNPTLVELEDGYINAMGLPNPGIDAFREEMRVACGAKVPIIGSVFAATAEDFALLANRMQEYGAEAVELNLSCPHAKGLGMEIGVDPSAVEAIVREARRSITVPLFAKLTPNTNRLLEVAEAAVKGGADGIVAINTLRAMAIDVEARRPILSNKGGGLSGPAIKPVGVRCIYDLHEAVGVPLIGVGGVETWQDALEYIMAGASAVQIGSAIGRRGMGVFAEINEGLSDYMDRHRVKNLMELVGAAHE